MYDGSNGGPPPSLRWNAAAPPPGWSILTIRSMYLTEVSQVGWMGCVLERNPTGRAGLAAQPACSTASRKTEKAGCLKFAMTTPWAPRWLSDHRTGKPYAQ